MPSINIDFLRNLKEDYNEYTNFIETGTYRGGTILHMEKYFSKLHTIEVKYDLYEAVKKKYKGDKINFHFGDSGEIFDKILTNIEGNSIIFLDGHFSGGCTGIGEKFCPLYEELNSIMLAHKDEAIIIIDDFRLFGKGGWKEINLETTLELVKNRITDHYFLPSSLHEKDRLVINISKK